MLKAGAFAVMTPLDRRMLNSRRRGNDTVGNGRVGAGGEVIPLLPQNRMRSAQSVMR